MTIRIGIIGTGYVAQEHLSALRRIEGVEIAGIAGRNAARVKELSSRFGGRDYEDYRRMLATERLDAAFVLTPPHVHGELEFECAQHVKAVLIEKPIANNLETALRVKDAFDKAGTIVSVGYMNRYRTGVRRAHDVFSSGKYTPILVDGFWVTGMPGPMWWRTAEQSGGQFVEQCTHLADLARWLAGEVVEVNAFAARGFVKDVPGYTVDDAMTVNLRFASGAVGNLTTGCFPRNGTDAGIGLSVLGQDVRCSFTGWGMETMIDFGKGQVERAPAEENIFEIQDRVFIDAVKCGDGSAILSSYADGMASLRVGLAANESVSGGRSVRI